MTRSERKVEFLAQLALNNAAKGIKTTGSKIVDQKIKNVFGDVPIHKEGMFPDDKECMPKLEPLRDPDAIMYYNRMNDASSESRKDAKS